MQYLENNHSCIDNMKFIDLWYEYDEFMHNDCKYQTIHKTEEKAKNHILPYFSDYYVKDINHIVINNWKKSLNENDYSWNYCSSLYGILLSIYNHANKFYNIDNIVKKVGNFPKRKIPKHFDVWCMEEYQKFISVIDDFTYKVFYETLYFTGLRQGECMALTWNDFKDNYLDINKTISKTMLNGEYVINSPKTESSIRQVLIDDNLIKSLNELLKIEKAKEDFNYNWFIFGGKKPLSATTILRRKNIYCEKANVKKIRIHDFRHSHATLLLSKGVPITVISKRLGHSNIEMTLNTYSHVLKDDEIKAITLLNALKTSFNAQNK